MNTNLCSVATQLRTMFVGADRRTTINNKRGINRQDKYWHYSPIGTEQFVRLLDWTGGLNCTGNFLDVGSGIGEATHLAYYLGQFTQTDGLEYNANLLAVAEFLTENWAGNYHPWYSGISTSWHPRWYHRDALDFDGYNRYDYLYTFNIAHESIIKKIYKKILQEMKIGATFVIENGGRDVHQIIKLEEGFRLATKVGPQLSGRILYHKTFRGVWQAVAKRVWI